MENDKMKNLCARLKSLSDRAEAIGATMRSEADIWEAEMRDRTDKGLTGEAATAHYNEWMVKAGRPDLCTD